MVEISVQYLGELRTEAVHAPSQSTLITDAPVDNQGKGEKFSPTDLVATALASCILTTIGIYAQRKGLSLEGASAKAGKIMSSSPPRKIAKIVLEISLPFPADHPEREVLERAARTCPVHASLHPDVEIPITFHWVG